MTWAVCSTLPTKLCLKCHPALAAAWRQLLTDQWHMGRADAAVLRVSTQGQDW